MIPVVCTKNGQLLGYLSLQNGQKCQKVPKTQKMAKIALFIDKMDILRALLHNKLSKFVM